MEGVGVSLPELEDGVAQGGGPVVRGHRPIVEAGHELGGALIGYFPEGQQQRGRPRAKQASRQAEQLRHTVENFLRQVAAADTLKRPG